MYYCLTSLNISCTIADDIIIKFVGSLVDILCATSCNHDKSLTTTTTTNNSIASSATTSNDTKLNLAIKLVSMVIQFECYGSTCLKHVGWMVVQLKCCACPNFVSWLGWLELSTRF
jgi:hypothetical protein